MGKVFTRRAKLVTDKASPNTYMHRYAKAEKKKRKKIMTGGWRILRDPEERLVRA
jgi:hypothetical protein